jgi:ketosteroid isomerase-like protein
VVNRDGRWKILAARLMVPWQVTEQQAPDTREADAEAIERADIAWSEAQGERGLDGMMEGYGEDPILMAPNMPAAIGEEAIRKAFGPNFQVPGFSAKWKPSKVEVARSCDLAYAIGSYVAAVRDASGQPVIDRGKYVEIWKKQGDGRWKVALDMFSSDQPVRAGSPFVGS